MGGDGSGKGSRTSKTSLDSSFALHSSSEFDVEDPHRKPSPKKDNAPRVQNKHWFNPGHWLTVKGAVLTGFVVALSAVSGLLPWWSLNTTDADANTHTQVTLWSFTMTKHLQVKETRHEGCITACDRTRVVQNKVKVETDSWESVCRHAEGGTRQTCNKIWVIRGGLLVACVSGFIYTTSALIAFASHDHRSAIRFPPLLGVVFAAVCLASLLAVLIVALLVQTPNNLDSEGFYCMVTALVLSLPNVVLAFLAMKVTDAVNREADAPQAERTEPPRVQKHAWK